MSILRLQRMTLLGLCSDRARVLEDLQALGCLELIPCRAAPGELAGSAPGGPAHAALRFLFECPERRRQFHDTGDFDASALQERALALRERLHALHDEADALRAQLELIRPWGDFDLPQQEEIGGLRLWFYRVPHHRVAEFSAIAEPWEIVRRDHACCYVVVVGVLEPEDTPVAREPLGSRSRHELEQRLQQVELAIEEADEQRAQMSHWCTLFARNLARLDDELGRRNAAAQTGELEPLFALEAWVPEQRSAGLRAYAAAHGLALRLRTPGRDESPPTRLHNPPGPDAGEALVTFYTTPGYWSWDPSAAVLVSFSVFFAMILADAGYAALLALLLLATLRRTGRGESARRLRTIAASCTGCALGYGVLVGSYFGLAPPADGVLARAALLDITDSRAMMSLAVLLGVLHLVYACLRNAGRHGASTAALAPLGWACAIAGGGALAAGELLGITRASEPGATLAAGGLLLVVAFTGAGEPWTRRIGLGLLALTRITGAFGDVLSYLRLFALGLASASLAGAFNAMAADLRTALPGLGLFIALGVLLLGHALNLLLGVAGGVIHGLRLNVIEFFNWGLFEEGRPFRPFAKKES